MSLLNATTKIASPSESKMAKKDACLLRLNCHFSCLVNYYYNLFPIVLDSLHFSGKNYTIFPLNKTCFVPFLRHVSVSTEN